MQHQALNTSKNALVPIVNNDKISWYWWFRGKFLSNVPKDFIPTSNDILEQLAWASIKYNHLGGPNVQHIVRTPYQYFYNAKFNEDFIKS